MSAVRASSVAYGALRRVMVTASATALFVAAERVPLPFLDWSAVRFLARGASPSPVALLAIGLSPFFPAFVLVECVAAAVPRWRAHRHGSPADRAPLTVAAWALALLMATAQAWSLAGTLQTTVRDAYGSPLLASGAANLLGVTSTLVLGTASAGWAALIVSRHGVGNGFAILFGVEAVERLAQRAAFYAPFRLGTTWTDVHLVSALAIAVAVPLVLRRILRERAARPRGAVPQVPFPTCGLVPLQLAPMLLVFPSTLLFWLGQPRLAEALWPNRVVQPFAAIAVAGGLAVVLGHLFCPAEGLLRSFRCAAGGALDDSSAAALRGGLSAANRRSWALVISLAAVPVAALAVGAPVPLNATTLFELAIVITVALDLGTELLARVNAPLAAAFPLQRVYEVDAALEALRAAGISGVARARRYRALFHFFAPYAPIEILVPPERVAEASAVCARIAAAP